MKRTIDMNEYDGMLDMSCRDFLGHLVENEVIYYSRPFTITVNSGVWTIEQIELNNEKSPEDIEFDLMIKNSSENFGDECSCCGGDGK